MESTPNYYSVLPAHVRYDTQLTFFAKVLYGEISALSNKFGYCFATNDYFAKLYHCTTTTVSQTIQSLLIAEHISIETTNVGGQNQRRLRLKIGYPHVKKLTGGKTVKNNDIQPDHLQENLHHNTTSIRPYNNTSILHTPQTETDTESTTLVGKSAHARLLSLYEQVWENKMGVLPEKVKLSSAGSVAVKKLNRENGEMFSALMIIAFFEWKGLDGKDPNANRSVANAGYPLAWIGTKSKLLRMYIEKTLKITTDEQAQESLQEVLKTLTKKHD